jgi:hypothetical protein
MNLEVGGSLESSSGGHLQDVAIQDLARNAQDAVPLLISVRATAFLYRGAVDGPLLRKKPVSPTH